MSHTSESPIPIITPGEDAEHEGPGDGGDRDPEVEALHPGEPAHLGHVHHAHDHGLDDQGGQHRLGQLGEQRRQNQKREQHDHAGGERGEAGACAGAVVQGARGQARRDRHPLEQAGADVGHPLARPTPG